MMKCTDLLTPMASEGSLNAESGHSVKKKPRAVIWGKGLFADKCSYYLSFIADIVCLIDSNSVLQGQEYVLPDKRKVPIISEAELDPFKVELAVIIPYGAERFDLKRVLIKKHGLSEDKIYFGSELIPKLAWDIEKKLVLQALTFFINTACSLSCKGCIAGIPDFKKNKHWVKPVEELRVELEQVFSKIDYVNLISLSTGDSFLHPDLCNILEEIGQWKNKYDHVRIVVNGVIIPKDDVLIKMARHRMGLFISDYSLEGKKNNINAIIEKCQQYKVDCSVFRHLQGATEQGVNLWSDVGDIGYIHDRQHGKTTKEIFNTCANRSCIVTHAGKIYGCGVALWQEFGGNYKCTDNDFVSLDEDKQKIMEYSIGMHPQGYYDICKYCDGVGPEANSISIPAGVQYYPLK